ncbi:MAG TPA: aminotransferase class I/II-fold pyridoxal phosphate-dependent enzyme [Pyrinomonadaceae bacterium]
MRRPPNVVEGPPDGDGAGNEFRMFVLDEAALEARRRGADVIQLTLGLSDLQPRAEILNAIGSTTYDPLSARRVCPAGLPELRQCLSQYYAESCGASIPFDRILVDAGTSSIFRNLFQIISRPGDEVLLPLPYYPLYRFSATLNGLTCRYYPINLETMRPDVEAIANGITEHTQAVVLNSPGNPLGNVISQADLEQILAIVPPDVYLIADEVYDNIHFSDDGRAMVTTLLSDPAWQSRIILTNSFSKGYRMYTRRVGWCVLPEEIVRPMTIIQQHTRLTVDPAVQQGAIAALQHRQDVSAVKATHQARWEYARCKLSNVPDMHLLPASGGFYCMLDCRQFIANHQVPNCLNLALDVLERVGVATVPGADFGLPGMLRLSFTSERFNEGTDRLHSYFAVKAEASAA